MVRSVLAVFTGWIVMQVAVVATQVAMRTLAPSVVAPTNPAYAIGNLLYSFAFAVLGGYIAAAIAPREPMRHAAALAGLLVLLGSVSMILGYSQPVWYAVLLTLVMPVAVLCGGLLRGRRLMRAD